MNYSRAHLAAASAAQISPRTLWDHLRSGRRLSPSAARLLVLHDSGRIIPADWHGIRVDPLGEHIEAPAGTVSPGQINQIALLSGFLAHAQQDIDRLRDQVARLQAIDDAASAAANDGVRVAI